MLEFVVYGKPATAGSKRGIPFKRDDDSLGVRMIHDNERFHTFAAEVKDVALAQAQGQFFERGPIKLTVTVFRKRPANHYRTGAHEGEIKDWALDQHEYPTTKPDLLKNVRAVEDALTGVLWKDDSQVVRHELTKVYAGYGNPEKTVIRVEAL